MSFQDVLLNLIFCIVELGDRCLVKYPPEKSRGDFGFIL